MSSTAQTGIIPRKAQILVIGGGPSGSYAATALAREGFDVVLLEAAKFPRYHIGESMLPSCRPFLKFVGVEEAVRTYGFCAKPGAALKLAQEKREGYTDFIGMDPNNGAWNVIRSEFDAILLRHAAKCGVKVFEETKVTEISFFNDEVPLRPIAAKWACSSANTSGTISFDYLVDASGRAGLMSQKYLKNRRINSSLKNIACWGYWKGTHFYAPGTKRQNAPWFEALIDESGWNWFIPLHNGTTSVGVVMRQVSSDARKREAKEANGGVSISLKEHYLQCLKLSPGIISLIGEGQLVDNGLYPSVQTASDFSYDASSYAGDHFRLIGDAAAFIDPFFSSGVHLAFTGGLAAAASISSSIRGQYTEEECCRYHNAKIGTAYTRFLIVVLSAYKQMQAQKEAVLSDVDEDNFDRAFDLIRPVIQGDADSGKKKLTEDELQKAIEFCSGVFLPVDPEMHKAVAPRLDEKLMSPSGTVLTFDEIDKLVGPKDIDAQMVLKEINARKPVHKAFGSTASFTDELIEGFTVTVEQGRLGLLRK